MTHQIPAKEKSRNSQSPSKGEEELSFESMAKSRLNIGIEASFGRNTDESNKEYLEQVGIDERQELQEMTPKVRKTKKQIRKEAQQKIKDELQVKRMPTAMMPIISIDTEYQCLGDENGILSYQYVVGFNGKFCKGIRYTKSMAKKDRYTFEKFLSLAIEDAIEEGVLTAWPEHVIVAAHYLKADLFTFSNSFRDIKTQVSSVRKTVASLGDTYGVDVSKEVKKRIDGKPHSVYDKNRNKHTLVITFYDSMLFAPAGYQSLEKLAELVDEEKIKITQEQKKNMHQFLVDFPKPFKDYAIQDAYIVYKFMLLVIDSVCVKQGHTYLPFTIGSIAVKSLKESVLKDYKLRYQIKENLGVNDNSFKQYFEELFGKETVKTEKWIKKKGATKLSPVTQSNSVLNSAAYIFEAMAIECYHGGRNECYLTGPSDIDMWHDYDAPSCYTVILNGLRALDYDNTRMTTNLDDFMGDVFGMARVRFKFPENTEYPCLPVRAEPYGLIYPLQGESYCVAAELEVARHMGCQVEILQGFFIPWLNDNRIFTPFMKKVRDMRQHYKREGDENPFLEKFWKEQGNSVYGRLAMGLKDKRVFDIKDGLMKSLQRGEVTNPFFAAFVSGTARALLSAMLIGVPTHRTVISLTTDGFITNATDKEIDLSQPVCQRFTEWFHMIDLNKGKILEEKNRMLQVLGIRTRGQVTCKQAKGWDGVNAKTGVQLPDEHTTHKAKLSKMKEIYLQRKPGDTYLQKSLTSTNNMMTHHLDLGMEISEQRLGLEPDLKRDLLPIGMVKVDDTEHLQCSSVPHRTVEDMIKKRQRFEIWRENNCLITMDDYENWEDFYKLSSSLKGTDIRVLKGDDSIAVFKRMFLRVWAQEKCGIVRDMKPGEFSKWLTSLSNGLYTTTPSAMSSAGNPEKSKVILGVFPVTSKIIRFLKIILNRYPNFDYAAMFNSGALKELEQAL
tara:strand:+ start:10891 stop:13746 length:2856 start_codon:yes stop_codon:yes gene_type:complete